MMLETLKSMFFGANGNKQMSSVEPRTPTNEAQFETLILSREYHDTHTFGRLQCDKIETPIHTLELPWVDNKNDISCIPEGTYFCKRHKSPSNGDCYELQNVPGRKYVQIHVGNKLENTIGCILPGLSAIMYKGAPFVTSSGVTMTKLFAFYTDGFNLIIKKA